MLTVVITAVVCLLAGAVGGFLLGLVYTSARTAVLMAKHLSRGWLRYGVHAFVVIPIHEELNTDEAVQAYVAEHYPTRSLQKGLH